MELAPHVDAIRRDLSAATALADDSTREIAARLGNTLDTSARMAMMDALSQACAEISRDLAPGSVEVRLAGRDPQFVVTAPPRISPAAEPTRSVPTTEDASRDDGDIDAPEDADGADGPEEFDEEDGNTVRLTFRLPAGLKNRVEAAANENGQSVNAWLNDAVRFAVDMNDWSAFGQGRGPRPPRPPRAPRPPRDRGGRRGGFNFGEMFGDMFGNIGEQVSAEVERSLHGIHGGHGPHGQPGKKHGPDTHVSGWVR